MDELEHICDDIFRECSGIQDNTLLKKMFGQMSKGEQVDLARMGTFNSSMFADSHRSQQSLETFRSVSNFGRLGSINTEFIGELVDTLDTKTKDDKSDASKAEGDRRGKEEHKDGDEQSSMVMVMSPSPPSNLDTDRDVPPPLVDTQVQNNNAESELDLDTLDGGEQFWDDLIGTLYTNLTPRDALSVSPMASGDEKVEKESTPSRSRKRSSLLVSLDPQLLLQKKKLTLASSAPHSNSVSNSLNISDILHARESKVGVDLSPIGFQSLLHASFISKSPSALKAGLVIHLFIYLY
ncbi:hypothetical protein RFI_19745 [Reticulomyxa filosa]|uniref:Uncharacterized protein n=1 Tax=Reticulomyxa filosa TaxID=46433 RepID=X6MVA0_RETFI|nr:hypothetical protein RFI_19745 [Reticulomyxa filosa]|eukprot:ETO17576.1 hypothetical protein RFI_19745 [Reticulomyxa filosa]